MIGFLNNLRQHPLRLVYALAFLLFLAFGSVKWWRSGSVLFTADGQTRRIFTKARTIKEFLGEQHIVLGPKDFTTPALDSAIGHKTAVKLTRVTVDTSVEVSSRTPVVTWQIRTRENLRRVLVQKGYAAFSRKRIQLTRYDGVEVSRKTLLERKWREPFFNLVLFNKNGLPAKKYNLLKCKVLKMRSTGYYVGEKTVPGNVTFLGHKLQHGLVAVDPKVIPLGTRLYVDGYGYAYASDTGSAIKGLRIDLAATGKKEEARYNRHNVAVFILEKARKW
jgi:3D (Asp-Asp-Asp) domain-containing protein